MSVSPVRAHLTTDGTLRVAITAAVPEPETYAPLLAGLGVVGALAVVAVVLALLNGSLLSANQTAQGDALVNATQALATQGKTNAQRMVAELQSQGITIKSK